jgi:uncharacterized repeat protein (TIGR01451 family)
MVSASQGTRGGFQLVALDSSNNSAGALIADADTEVRNGASAGFPNRNYISHMGDLNRATTNKRQWDFQWTAPSAGTGTVTFYIAGLAALDNTFLQNNDVFASITRSSQESVPLPTVSISDAQVIEGNSGTSLAIFNVTLSSQINQTVTVNYSTVNQTAIAPTDYAAAGNQTLTFNPNQTQQTIMIAVNGDTTTEPDETFLVNLSNPANATIADGQATGGIINDDPLPAINISDAAAVNEGNIGTINASFLVSLSNPSSQTVSVNFSTSDGTATAGSDYATKNMQVTFTPGQTQQNVTVQVNGDTADESNETFLANLSSPVNGAIGDSQAVATIIDDDGASGLSINSVTVDEGDSGTANVSFTVSLLPESGQTVMVSFSTANQTATAPDDYASTSGTLTFNPGETSKAITVQIKGDTAVESNETFLVILNNPVNAAISTGQGVCTIVNDDSASLPSLSITDVQVSEGNAGATNAVFTVTLSQASSQTVTVTFATANGTATAGSDYTALAATMLTFNPGEVNKNITAQVIGDTLVESNETFSVVLSNASNATIGDNQGLCTIIDDDGATPSANLSVTQTASAEAVNIGEELTYTIVIRNNGPSNATGVRLTDTLPAGVTFISASTGCAPTANTINCDAGNLNTGAQATLTITVRADAEGTITNTATASANEPDPQQSNNTAALSIQITGKPVVTEAMIDGKKLIVEGRNFRPGAKIFVNGKKQKTQSDSANPTSRLIAKKGGKNLVCGQSVLIRIMQDGGDSDDFVMRIRCTEPGEQGSGGDEREKENSRR